MANSVDGIKTLVYIDLIAFGELSHDVSYVVVKFHPWFKLYFLSFLCMVMYDNDMIMGLKQEKIKFKPRIKLNHNMYMVTTVTGFSIEGGTRQLIAAYFGIYSRLLCV